MTETAKPILGITMGDPAGVGPEIAVMALAKKEVYQICRPVVIGDANVIERAAGIAAPDITVRRISAPAGAKFDFKTLDVIDLRNVDVARFQVGEISAMAGNAAFEYVRRAIDLAQTQQIDAIVTNPIHKEALNLAGHHFAGHTEILAHYTHSKNAALLLAHGNLRVIHVSTHVPLREACDLVKKDRILQVIRILDDACRRFGLTSPQIGVAGLNPHASDGGLFGHEEADEILPAVVAARADGLDVEGPMPPDTLFAKAQGGFYDGVVAMYHDQGHIAFKLQTFTFDENRRVEGIRGVNITLGLPIIRTSVVHGTAFDIAWQGIANPATLVEAIEYAARMAAHKKGA